MSQIIEFISRPFLERDVPPKGMQIYRTAEEICAVPEIKRPLDFIRDQLGLLKGTSRAAHDALSAGRNNCSLADAEIIRLQQHGPVVDDDNPLQGRPHVPRSVMVKAEATSTSLREDVHRLSESARAVDVRKDSFSRLHQRAEDAVTSYVGKPIGVAAIKVPRGATVEGQQSEVKGLRANAASLKDTMEPREVWRDRIRKTVESLGQGPKLRLNERGLTISWPRDLVAAEASAPGVIPSVHDAAAIAAWLNPEKVISELEAQLELSYAGREVMSAAEKAAKLKEIRLNIEAAERIEAALMWSKLRAGENVLFRPDIDIRAVLGVIGPIFKE